MLENLSPIIVSLITTIGTVVVAILVFRGKLLEHKREINKLSLENKELTEQNVGLSMNKKDYELKLDVFNKIMDMASISEINSAVYRLFKNTKADRFLILIARNGKEDFNIVTAIYEIQKEKEAKVNCIRMYRNVNIDNAYRQLLKECELNKTVIINTDQMEESLLKDYYLDEDVKHSLITHIQRQHMDENNDIIIYSSVATRNDNPFTKRELTRIKTAYENSIITSIGEVVK